MSRHPRAVLVDGYNLLHAIPRFAPRGDPLEPAREELEAWLAQAVARHGSPDTVIVWDGRSGARRSRSTGPLRVLYTPRGESADERILALCRDSYADRAGSTWVVSSDRDIQDPARQLGFPVLGAMTFYRRWRAGGERSEANPKGVPAPGKPRRASRAEVEDWLEEFLAEREDPEEEG